MDTKGMKCIGRGAFSTVYVNGRNKVLIKSEDKVKECMALGWFPSTPLFPILKRVGSCEDRDCTFYEEKLYAKVRSLKNTLSHFEYEFYKALRSLTINRYNSGIDGFQHWHSEFEKLPRKFHRKKKLLREALDGLSNYGTDICFEISPRNVAVQGNKIVLLDCFFFVSALKVKL